MSVRGLATLAALLFVLCAAAAGLLLHRLGWLEEAKPIEWTFENPTLAVARGQRIVLRPIVEGVPPLRYTFLAAILEPRTDDPVAPVPHLRAGVEELENDTWLYRPPVQPLDLCQMGALTPQEWLIEIRPVLELRDSGEERMLLKAVYGHRTGAFVSYYHDPERPLPAVGWMRSEMVTQNAPPEVHFATDGGLAEVPEKPEPEKPK